MKPAGFNRSSPTAAKRRVIGGAEIKVAASVLAKVLSAKWTLKQVQGDEYYE
jgi:hypothetical protein